jgi:hypothetical protein
LGALRAVAAGSRVFQKATGGRQGIVHCLLLVAVSMHDLHFCLDDGGSVLLSNIGNFRNYDIAA